jgi:hypothetical protein
MKTKILIYIEGGNLQMIASNTKDIDIVLVDRDNQDAGDNPVIECNIDNIVEDGNFKSLFTFQDNSDREIYEELDNLKF